MQIDTTRFGVVPIEADDLLFFPAGLIGLEDCQHWVILADTENEAIGWLQSLSRADMAMAVISPRRFVTDYQVRVTRGELSSLQLSADDRAYILAIVAQNDDRLTLNLKAPLIINLDRRMGRQVVTSDDQPLQYEMAPTTLPLRRSA